jgi:hypothetical protein
MSTTDDQNNTFNKHKITKYVLDIQSEHNYISKKWYTKYQLHVSATLLAIIRLYSTYNKIWLAQGVLGLIFNFNTINSHIYSVATDVSAQLREFYDFIKTSTLYTKELDLVINTGLVFINSLL